MNIDVKALAELKKIAKNREQWSVMTWQLQHNLDTEHMGGDDDDHDDVMVMTMMN